MVMMYEPKILSLINHFGPTFSTGSPGPKPSFAERLRDHPKPAGVGFFIAQSCLRTKLEAPGVKERKLAGWGLSRGKAWKNSLNVTKKNAPQMEANMAMLEDALTVKPLSSCCIGRRSRQPKWNGSRKTSKMCILPAFHSPVMQKTL